MSSMIRPSNAFSRFNTLLSFKSRLATSSSCTNKLHLQKNTLRPARISSCPNAESKCVFPEPQRPKTKRFSRRSRNEPSNSVRTCRATFNGRRFRSKLGRSFSAGIRDWRNRRSIRCARRLSHSCRHSSSRYCSYDSVSRSARRACSSKLARIEGKCNSFKYATRLAFTSLLRPIPHLREQCVKTRQVGRRHGNGRHRRRRLAFPQQRFHGTAADRLLALDQYPQRLIDSRLALVCRQVQDLQIFPVRLRRPQLVEQVVGDAETTGGKQFLAVAVVRQRSRLAHQRVDHMPIVDVPLAAPAQPRQRGHQLLGVPYLQMFQVNPHVD